MLRDLHYPSVLDEVAKWKKSIDTVIELCKFVTLYLKPFPWHMCRWFSVNMPGDVKINISPGVCA